MTKGKAESKFSQMDSSFWYSISMVDKISVHVLRAKLVSGTGSRMSIELVDTVEPPIIPDDDDPEPNR
jgi:hypothetical protein